MNRADFDLLLGILALQNGFIDPPALVAAFHVWCREKQRPLAEILEARGDLSASRRALLVAIVEEHLRGNAGDPTRSLAALPSDGGAGEALRTMDDLGLQASLDRLGIDPPGTGLPRTEPASEDLGEPSTQPFASVGTHGRFRVLRPHAKGGLGTVAVAIDSELHREVALKQIQPAYADRSESRARFLLEAEITGGLEHPGIVPVYSLGHDSDGRPYYAMRFIQGDSLHQTTARFHQAEAPGRDPGDRALEFQKLLRRFLDVCNAIAYAHSRGVLHRDIKPGNVMVGPFGETLVVDWGLAKVVGKGENGDEGGGTPLRPPSAHERDATRIGLALGTPQFMSPEQASGAVDQLGPKSDVYSLGATLYCLLTGKAPFPPDGTTEILGRVRRGEFAAPRQVKPSVSPALEAVCLKAMALRPEDRYPSARALGEEIERWLADEPVSAYREPWTARARRWTKRHRALVTTTAAVLVVGAASLAGISALLGVKNSEIARKNVALLDGNRRLAEERQRAEAGEAQAVDAIKKFRDVVAENPDLKEREEFKDLRKTLLKEPLAFFQTLRDRLQASDDTRPETLLRLAEAAGELGALNEEIGGQQDAIRAYQEALAGFERLARDHPGDQRIRVGLAKTYGGLGTLRSQIGPVEQARALLRKAESAYGQVADASPEDVEILLAQARIHGSLGVLDRQEGRLADAIAAYEQARAVFSRIIVRHPENTNARTFLAVNRISVGELRKRTGQPDEGLAVTEEARTILEGLVRDHPVATQPRVLLALCLRQIGEIQHQIGQSDRAIEAYRESLRHAESLAREHPSNIPYQEDLAGVSTDLGKILSEIGRPTEAVASYQGALEISDRLAQERPDDVEGQRRLGLIHFNLGLAQQAAFQANEALASWGRSQVIQEELARRQPTLLTIRSDLASTLLNLGVAETLAGRTSARAPLEKARILYDELTTANPEITAHWIGLAKCHGSLALLLERVEGQPEEALAANAKALEINRRAAEAHPSETQVARDLAAALAIRASLLERLGRRAEAIGVYGEAIDALSHLVESGPGLTEPRAMLGQCHGHRGALLAAGGRPIEALDAFREAQKLYEGLASDHPDVIEHQNGLAASLGGMAAVAMTLGRTDEALSACREALEAFERLSRLNPGAVLFRSNAALCHENIGELLLRKGRPAEAVVSLEKARTALEQMPRSQGSQRQLAQVLCHLGVGYGMAGRPDEARAAYRDAIAQVDPLVRFPFSAPECRALLARCHSELAELELNAGRPAEARAPLRSAWEILERLVREQPEVIEHRANLALAMVRTATMLRAMEEPAESLRAFEEAVAMLEPLSRFQPNEAGFLELLGHAMDQLGQIDMEEDRPSSALDRFTQATDHQRRAVALQPGNSESRQRLIGILEHRTLAARALGREGEVLVSRREQSELLDRTFPVDPFAQGAR